MCPGEMKNALRMLRKPPGRGEQVASVRPPRSAASADRCPPVRRPLSPRRPREHMGPGPPRPVPRRGLPGRAVPSPAARPPAPPPHAWCPVPTPRPGRARSDVRQRGFPQAEPAPPARRRSPVPRAHDAHFQGRRCHGQAGTQQTGARLPGRPPAPPPPARPEPAAARGSPAPPASRPMAATTPARAPRATADSREDPPRHSREPPRTPGPGWPPGPAPAPPSPARGLSGLVVRAPWIDAPAAPLASPGGCALTRAPGAGGCTSLPAEQS